ncbi:hypothetical protein PYW08_016496 [Mythimna loreyi]|uniref:Uncharacterized protein n=1 Tax=Mythimna loreyi TaxID=667449 RepID=A0ACC2QXG3_9NEOP|nr:hypothetical protein PYW08_016496 [Mythimna loreyi]
MRYKNAKELYPILKILYYVKHCCACRGAAPAELWGREAACRGDDARHALLTWRAAAPPSLRWQLSQHSPGVVCAPRKAVCRAACKGAHRSRQGCRTLPRRRQESAAYEDSVNIPEGEDTATGARAETPRSSTRSGAAGSRWASASSSETRRQLLVSGAGGRAGGRLTRGGGRVHARVAPAVRGRQRVARGLAVARAGAARARAAARRGAPLPQRLPRPRLRHPAASRFLTGVLAPLLSAARED